MTATLDSLPNLEMSSLRLWGLASSPRIHRFWLQRPGGACFADLYFCSVASFAPLSQTVWYLGQLPAVTRRRLEAIDGVRVELLPNHVFPSSLALWLAACLPVPLVKDLVYLRLLFVYGGVALDLDLLSLGKRLPKTGSRQGFTAWTCQEVNRPAGRLFHRTEPLVNFGAMGSEPALTWMGNLEQRLRRHWVSWVVGVMRGEQQEPDWATWGTCGRVVMYNQRELTKALSAAQPGCIVFPSMHFHPLHHWLRSWSALGSVHGPSGVSIPGEEEVVREACCLNVWASQWPADLQRAAAEWAAAIRNARVGDGGSWRAGLPPDVRLHCLARGAEGDLAAFVRSVRRRR